jgi:hypothetical protein
VPEVPGVLERDWTPLERCGGTPEAQATRYALERPTPAPRSPPLPMSPDRDVIIVPVLILPVLIVPVTETPTPETTPVTLVERVLAPPVQLPEGEN